MNDLQKFRIWDAREGCYDVSLLLGQDGEICYCDGSLVDPYGDRPEDYVVERCTGILDQYGRLIFEGDIINGKYGPNVIKGKAVKLAKDGCFVVFCDDLNVIVVSLYDLEIVGNVHVGGQNDNLH